MIATSLPRLCSNSRRNKKCTEQKKFKPRQAHQFFSFRFILFSLWGFIAKDLLCFYVRENTRMIFSFFLLSPTSSLKIIQNVS